MKKAGILVLTIVLSSASVFSQDWTGQGRQIGYVYDEEGNPLEGVKVKLFFVKTQSGFELTTDKDGKWVALGIKGGTWYIDFEMPGYLPKKISWNVLDFRQTNPPLEVKLEKAEGLVLSDELRENFRKGATLYEEGNYEEAIKAFTTIIEEYPDAYIINLNIGNSYFQMENYDEAEKFYRKVIQEEPDNHMALMGIGNCYSNRGDSEKAMEWYNKIEFEKINDPAVLFNVGTTFYNSSNYEEALKYYKKSVEIEEGFLDGIYQLGLTYLALGRNAEALGEFEKYLTHDPDSEKASQVKGFIEYLKKETDEGYEDSVV